MILIWDSLLYREKKTGYFLPPSSSCKLMGVKVGSLRLPANPFPVLESHTTQCVLMSAAGSGPMKSAGTGNELRQLLIFFLTQDIQLWNWEF